MKKWLGMSLLFLLGCHTHWVYTPVPQEPVSMQTAVRASGELLPQNFYFTLISEYAPSGQARVIILTDPALKLADLTISAEQVQVHYRAPNVSGRMLRAWVELVRAHFLVSCPPRKIVHQTAVFRGIFELEVMGGICL